MTDARGDVALRYLDATAQAELVHSGQIGSSELVELAIDRISEEDDRYNAVVHPRFDDALQQSLRLQRGRSERRHQAAMPFLGVPLLIKDALCMTEGDPYHLGTRFLQRADWRAPHDAELAKRFRAAGFVHVGRTTTPEFATSVVTESFSQGITRNPWNTSLSPGGSSGGSAASVAAGFVPVAHGTDMAGSLRIPAAYCGLVGLKPSRGRVTFAPDFDEYWGPVSTQHVLTRSVRDSARILDVIAGPATGDPYQAPPPADRWAAEVDRDPGELRIGLFDARRTGVEVDEECHAGVESAGWLLESLGHAVEWAGPDALTAMPRGSARQVGSYLAHELKTWSTRLGTTIGPEHLEPANARLVELGLRTSATTFIEVREEQAHYVRSVAAWWDHGWDVLVTPTTAGRAPAVGVLGPNAEPKLLGEGIRRATVFTGPFNLTGQPAMSLPLHWDPSGLPVGVQFVARYGREDVLFRLAGQLERARGWLRRYEQIGG